MVSETTLTVSEFLKALLQPAPPEAVGWCCQFANYAEQRWGGAPCTPESAPRVNGCDAYYSISAFWSDARFKAEAAKSAAAVERRRVKEQAEGACVVLCDDVGTKASPESVLAMLGEPSFKIRTSEKSQQWGYLLQRLATDEELRPIHERLLALKLCDKNGNNLVRYGRLPAGINNKPDYPSPFAVKCEEWHPERRFAVEAIAQQLAAHAAATEAEAAAPAQDEFEALAAVIESGEDYHEPLMKLAAKYSARGLAPADIVSVLQGHMLASEDRTERWGARFEDIQRTVNTAVRKFAPPDRGDKILLRAGLAREAVQAALGVLARRGVAANIFVRGSGLVRPHVVERRGFNEEIVQSLEVALLNARALAHELNGLVNFFTRDAKGRAKPQDCPGTLAATVLSIPHAWHALPALDTIASVPIYRGGGRLISTPGYQAELRAWLTVPPAVQILERPTRNDAEAALRRVQDWVQEFPFAAAADRAVMIAALLTAALRPSLSTAPAFGFDAPEFGTGKTTAAKLVNIVLTGRSPAVMQFSEDGIEELRKHVQAAMLEGRQSIVIDNVPTGIVLTSAVLAQVLTEPFMDVRELGLSRTHRIACTQLVLVTGNNLQVGDDLTRRMLVARLDSRGDPTARVYNRPNLLQEAQGARAALLTDLFTLVAAYEAAGENVNAQVLVGYEQWSRWVQQPLIWLGCADPVESVRRLQAEDPDRDLLDEATQLWDEIYGAKWVSVKALATYDAAFTKDQKDAQSALLKLLGDECGRDREGNLDRRAVGRWVKSMKGRWTPDGLRLEQQGRGESKTKRSALWRVVAAEGIGGSGGYPGALRARDVDESRNRGEVWKPSSTPATLHDEPGEM